MKIDLKKIPIRDLVDGYISVENATENDDIKGFNNKLTIRPKYQRNFVYDENQQRAVINTVLKGFPLNVMYWVKRTELEDEYEVLDGQQRTLSICQFISNKTIINYNNSEAIFDSLPADIKEKILNYELMVYFCEGEDSEKLDWFKTINIAGEKLNIQELRNAIYTGTWLSDVKSRFSKTNCAAYLIGKDYVEGSPIRQDYLETALNWINKGNKDKEIETYMLVNQNQPNAIELWNYFNNLINWVKTTFQTDTEEGKKINYRKEMKSVNWGYLYNEFGKNIYDVKILEKQISQLMQDDEVSNKKGIYYYIFTNNEKYLNIRAFTHNQRREAYERQNGICSKCKEHFELNEMEADHITPWSQGGKTSADNCQMLCMKCNRTKSDK